MEIEKVKFVRKQPKVALTYIQGTLTTEDSNTEKKFASDIDAVVGVLGLIFLNTDTGAWLSASDLNQTMAESFSVLTTSLEKRTRLRFTVAKDELKVNGDDVELLGHHAKAFMTHLSAFGDINFTVTKGVEKEEFAKFMTFLCKKPYEITAMGEFTDALNKQAFPHVSSKKILLREVSEEEVVVAKDEFEAASAEEKQKIESDIVSFLSTDGAGDTDEASSIRKVVHDSQKMSDLILQAVEKKQIDPSKGPQQVASMVVECLDRAFDALLDDPFSKTQKGKKAIAGALKNLEKELLSKLAGGETKSDETETVGSAVERMTERLKMDSIVQDYSKKLKSLEDSEKRILRFIKLQGLDRVQDADLQKKLTDEGVDVDGWHKLLALSGTSSGTLVDDSQEAHTAVEQLASLLDKLTVDTGETRKEGAEPKKSAGRIAEDLKNVTSKVDALTARTQKRINTLVETVNADLEAVAALEQEATKKGLGPKLSRKDLLVVLGEVVQELCQPIAVITCSLQMVESKSLGEIADGQIEMIKLALESTRKMNTLVANLGRISGQPMTRAPDKNIQDALYEEPDN